jgi:peptide/nickel transport system permease protein
MTTIAEAAPESRTRRGVPTHLWRYVPLLLLVLVAVVGPFLVPFDPTKVVGPPSRPPGSEFWFGTDSQGLDVFSRTITAFRLNLTIALLVTALATVVGIAVGVLVGLNESRPGPVGGLARAGGRVLDLIDAVPAVVVGLVVVALFGATGVALVGALAFILMPNQARLTRTETLRVRHESYVEAARVSGLSDRKITVLHVVPNSALPALENTSLVFGVAIIVCAALGFLGVGLPPPTPEWGAMISNGAADLGLRRWWAVTFPTLALIAAVAAVAGAGRGLLTALRPPAARR